MENKFFIHKAHEAIGQEFGDLKTPQEIRRLFEKMGYPEMPENIIDRLHLLSKKNESGGSHFRDALEISEILDNLMEVALPPKDLKKLRMAGLVHDVGKTGPVEADTREKEAFVLMYNFSFKQETGGKNLFAMSIEEAIETKVKEGIISENRGAEIINLIESAIKKQKIKRPETEIDRKSNMRMFYSAHVYWSHDILKEEKVDSAVCDIAASHHILEGHNPSGLPIEEISESMAALEVVDKYHANRLRLVIADKYQAFRKRGGKTHEETIEILTKTINEKLKDSPRVRQVYLDILHILDKNREIVEKELEIMPKAANI